MGLQNKLFMNNNIKNKNIKNNDNNTKYNFQISSEICKLSINIIMASFLLGLGGLSILLQVWSTISKTDLSIKPYILGKLLHACISAFYTFLFLQNFTFFNFNL